MKVTIGEFEGLELEATERGDVDPHDVRQGLIPRCLHAFPEVSFLGQLARQAKFSPLELFILRCAVAGYES